MTPRAIRRWKWTHKWTSLVCTVFLLYLCLTGLPLIFHHEIEEATRQWHLPDMARGTPHKSFDDIVAAAQARHPERTLQFAIADDDVPDGVLVSLGKTAAAQADIAYVVVDARTAEVVGEPDLERGVMYVLLKLHTDMFAGLPGKLFLGVMGMIFAAAVVSGVVVYKPYMRRLAFATVRARTRRLRWLDLHNVLGIVTVAWVLVVGITGVINTWADLAIKFWQFDQMAAMTAPYRGQPPLAPAERGSVQRALDTAQAALPDRELSFVAFPGTLFSSPHHYDVFMRGKEPLTRRLVQPALVDARTGALTDTRALPWYITSILVSQPLHFGDYGGMPLKVVWALLDVITIVVLGSGVYLWLVKRRRAAVDDEDKGGAESASLEPRAALTIARSTKP
ncbi:MAG TPA: PepSY domain-containing protein [Burkholderiales bacterium]|nr:PepSY domain-containing protein [Burkholderiales bacterium]